MLNNFIYFNLLTNLVGRSELDCVEEGYEVEVSENQLDHAGEAHPQDDRSVVVRQRGKPQNRERGYKRDGHRNSDRNLFAGVVF